MGKRNISNREDKKPKKNHKKTLALDAIIESEPRIEVIGKHRKKQETTE